MMSMCVVCGPTATGKTALAIRLARQFNGELISADSRQVYRGMDIGTGKDLPGKSRTISQSLTVTLNEETYRLLAYDFQGISIWMYDVVDPNQEFSVRHYADLARHVLEDIQKRGKLPIVVGGTGLYSQSILAPIETSSVPTNTALRKELSLLTKEALQQKIQTRMPDVWKLLNHSERNNPRRLIRKLEISLINSSLSMDLSKTGKREKNDVDSLIIGLRTSFSDLYERIDARVEQRVHDGIIDEIGELLQRGYSWDLPSMSALGYRQWKPLFQKSDVGYRTQENATESTKRAIIQKWKYDEHAYARRQMTWFKKQRDIAWFDIRDDSFAARVTEKVRRWYTDRKPCTQK